MSPALIRIAAMVLFLTGWGVALANDPPLATWTPAEAASFGRLAVGDGDRNGDGFSDFVLLDSDGWAWVYHGSVAGPQYAFRIERVDGVVIRQADWAGDVDGDGYDELIVGVPTYNNDAGGAFVFPGTAVGGPGPSTWSSVGAFADDYFGSSVSRAGDVNGDGYDDVIITAPEYAVVFHGSPTGLSQAQAWNMNFSGATGSEFWRGTTAGDVNGDGYDDVVLTVPNATVNSENSVGKVLVFHGSWQGLSPPSEPDRILTGGSPYEQFGYSANSAGEVNGDGYDDLLVGAPFVDPGSLGSAPGRAYAYYGSSEGVSALPDWVLPGRHETDELGYRVVGAGDVTGDGYDDVVIGAGNSDIFWAGDVIVQLYYGAALVYEGSPNGIVSCERWEHAGELTERWVGREIGAAGDVDGDGAADFLVSQQTPNLTTLYYGASDLPDLDADQDGFCATDDCDDTNPNCTIDCSDGDGDTYCDDHDCAASDPDLWSIPDPVDDLLFDTDKQTLFWSAPGNPGGVSLRYDTLSSTWPPGFGSPAFAECVGIDETGEQIQDGTTPPPGGVLYYVVRPENSCGGTIGAGSDGFPRVAMPCD